MSKKPSFRDLTELSAYLDGELNAPARKKMEDRLARDPELASALDDLRLSRTVLRRTPKRRAPRNFTLSPQMVAKRPPMPRLVPALNYASLMAMLLFLFSFLGPIAPGAGSMANQEMASAPMMEEEFAAEEAPMLEMAPEPAAADSAMGAMPVEESTAPAAESPAMEDVAPAAKEPTEEGGVNLGEVERTTVAADDAESGVQAEKTFAATTLPAPTITPTPFVPPAQIESSPLLTPYQRTLVILLVSFVILGWLLRRATISKWQKSQ